MTEPSQIIEFSLKQR